MAKRLPCRRKKKTSIQRPRLPIAQEFQWIYANLYFVQLMQDD